MRGLGLSWLWVLAGTSDADDRCPTQLVLGCGHLNYMTHEKGKNQSTQ